MGYNEDVPKVCKKIHLFGPHNQTTNYYLVNHQSLWKVKHMFSFYTQDEQTKLCVI